MTSLSGNFSLPFRVTRLFTTLPLLFIATASEALPVATNELGIVRVGLYENRPKIYTDQQGRATGFFPQLLESIAARESWRIEYVPGSWQENLDRLSSGDIDIMPDVALSPERLALFDFNLETVLISWASIYSRPDVNVQSFQDLSGLRVALLKGGIYSGGPSSIRAILERLELNAQYVELETYNDVFQSLSDGRADVGVVNNIFGAANQDEYNVVATPILFQPTQLRFAISKVKPERSRLLLEGIDEQLRALKGDPHSSYYRAIDQHLYGIARSAAVVSEDLRSFLSPSEKEWISRHPQINMGIDPEFYPFIFRDDHGNVNGIGAEYIALLGERLGLNMIPSPPLSWAESIEQFRRGELDVLPCVGITQERMEYALYTKEFIEYQRVIITRSDFPFIAGMDDLQEIRVGVQADTSHAGFLKDHTTISPRKYASIQDSLLGLSAGEVDAIVGNLASSTYWIRRLNLINLKVAAQAGSERYTLHFAVRKDWPELVTILDKGLDLISPEEKQAIRNRWISIDYRPGIEPRVAWRIGLRIAGGTLIVLLAILLWSYNLKREIRRRTLVEQQLKFRVGFERLVSETLFRFISVAPDRVDHEICVALTEIAIFNGSTAACLYRINDDGTATRTHAGGEVDKLNACGIHPDTDPPDAPWLVELKAGRPVIAYARNHPEGSIPPTVPAPPWLTNGSLLEVPHAPEDMRPGFFSLVDIEGHAESWRTEDIGLFRLVGQIFSGALRNKSTEESLQKYAGDLESANRRLQELDRLKNLFIASVSHELRTPLNSIIGFTGVILKGMAGDLNERQQDQLNRVYMSAKHLLSLITDIIDISKIEAGHIDTHPQVFNIDEVIREAMESIQPMARVKGLTLTADVPAGLSVRTDRKRVRQCILNFLSNAVKYSESGTVSVRASKNDHRIDIAVADTGIGISPEDQQKLFAPFIRLDSHLRVQAGGTGLGLYLTRKIVVEILQGEIHVNSRKGEGSVFSISIPHELKERETGAIKT